MRWLGRLLGAACLCATASSGAWADDSAARGITLAPNDPSYVVVGLGSWEVARDNLRRGEVDASYRPDYHVWLLRPQVGFVGAGDGDAIGYAGFLLDIDLGRRVVLTGNTAVGVWGGGGIDLGSRVLFRNGAELAWRFDDASRLGFGFYHASNADLTRRNPGSESAIAFYAIPIGR